MNTLITGLVFVPKLWFLGFLLVWLVVLGYFIFWFAYDWRWYIKKELPPNSVRREIKKLEKLGWIKHPFYIRNLDTDLKIKNGPDGKPTGEVTVRFTGECGKTALITFYSFKMQIRHLLARTKELKFIFSASLIWPVCLVEYIILTYRNYRKR